MELVKLKGTGDGVKIYLSPTEEFSKIIRALHDKLDEFRKFFGTGHCNIYIIGRELTKSDQMRLESIVSAMLPESVVTYGERKVFRTEPKEEPKAEEPAKEEEEKTEEESEETEENADEEKTEDTSAIPVQQIKEVVTNNFKSNRARLYEGVVRSGKTVESDGHLVLMGDVEAGGKLIAVGNIVVMGSLLGEAEAGCMGNSGAYIAALELNPQRLSISGMNLVPETPKETSELEPEKAYLINNEIKIEKIWSK